MTPSMITAAYDVNDPDNPVNCPPEYLAYLATHPFG